MQLLNALSTFPRLAIVLAVTLVGAGFPDPSLAVGDTTDARVASVQQQLQRYQASRSIDDLSAAADLMQGSIDLDTLTPQNFDARRRQLVRGWALVLKAIDDSYDRTYNPKARFIRPVPPMENGREFAPCSDPAQLRDPKIRSDYAAALAAFNAHTAQAAWYNRLNVLDQRVTAGLSASLDFLRKIAPDGVGADFTALDGILQSLGLSSARRAKIDAMFYARPGQ